MAFPPPEEQRGIADDIDRLVACTNAKTDVFQREIDLLREYRTRLVSDVVTGKLDVREAAARVLEEAEPDATEDDIDSTDEGDTADEEVAA